MQYVRKSHPLAAVPLLDGHNDALSRLLGDGPAAAAGFIRGDGSGDLDLPRARAAGLRAAFFALFADDPSADLTVRTTLGGWAIAPQPPLPRERAHRAVTSQLLLLHELAAASERALTVADSPAALDLAAADGPLAAIPHLEGAEAIDPRDLDDLWRLRSAGLRSLGPVWSRPNGFGHGVPFRLPSSPDTGPGLTAAGRALLRECVAAGVLVDLAHLNARGFHDAARLLAGERPLVASHTSAHALTPSARALTDDQLDAIAQSGGLAGISFHGPDLADDGGSGRDVTLGRIAAHVEHVAERAGIEHVALGSDFDGAVIPTSIGDVSGLPRLLQALRERGWREHDLEALAHRNWLRVIDRWWK